MKMKRMETITARELYEMKLSPANFIVDGLLPRGLHIFAGPPKVGKSWLLLQLALAVASGNTFWGLQTEQGTVLSLCLEDNYTRLQKRISELTDEPPDTLHLTILSKSLDDGLCEQLEMFLKEHADTNLIVIDTLQKIRGCEGDGNLYASDYQDNCSCSHKPLLSWKQPAFLLPGGRRGGLFPVPLGQALRRELPDCDTHPMPCPARRCTWLQRPLPSGFVLLSSTVLLWTEMNSSSSPRRVPL